MCKGSNTTTTSTSPNPAAYSAYSNLLTRAQDVANTPYQSYTGELVAPVNEQQQLGISNVNANAGFASPYIQQAAGLIGSATQPLSAADIQQYLNPYTQSVVDATQRQFQNYNAGQQQQLLGNAIQQRALGGNRVGVAQAELAKQQALAQDPMIAGLYSQGYSQALQAAMAQQQNRLAGAYGLGNLGVAGQNAGLQGAMAQYGVGALPQQTQQALDTARYQQWLAQQGYPFQTTQWLAGIDTGVGSQMGGMGATTTPPPNQNAQYAGLGLAAASLFLNDGGRVPGFDDGGGVAPYGRAISYVPQVGLGLGQGAPRPPTIAGGQAADNPMKMAEQAMGLVNKFRGAGSGLGGITSGVPAGDMMGAGLSSAGTIGADIAGAGVAPAWGSLPFAASAGMAEIPAWAALPLVLKRGGRIPGFADAGAVGDSFDDRFSGFAPSPVWINPGATGVNNWSEIMADPAGLGPMEARPEGMGVESPPDDGMNYRARTGNPVDTAGLPPEILYGTSNPQMARDDDYSSALGFDATNGQTPTAGLAPTAAGPSTGQQFGLGFLSPAAKMGLLAAGLGMMSSKSPHLGTAIGEGGLQGLAAYTGQKKAEQEAEKSKATIEMARTRLDQQAKDAAARLAETTRHNQSTENYRRDVLSQGKVPPGYAINPDGTMRAIPGGPADPTVRQGLKEPPAGYKINPDGSMSFIPGGPADPTTQHALATAKEKEKPLPTAIQKDLGEKGQAFSTLGQLDAKFRPEFGGFVSAQLGDVSNWLATRGILGSEDAADWWAQYAGYRNVVRNKLFGSALTANESREWQKQDINPGMKSEMIQRNLNRQRDVIEGALKRRADSLIAQKYSKEAIEAELGISLDKITKPAGPRVGERKQFKQGVGVWDGSQWVPEAP